MDHKFKKAKEMYENIEIPKELDLIVNETIDKFNNERDMVNMKNRKYSGFTKTVAACVVACGVFVAGLNMNSSFATKVAEIPVLGNIAKVLTFVDYEIDSDSLKADIKIPLIKGLNDKELEVKINNEIKTRIDKLTEIAKKDAQEYKQAYLETGGKEEDLNQISFEANYEIKNATEDVLSFLVYTTETINSAMQTEYYYNIDMKTNENITLKSLLGDKYIDIVNENIKKQIKERTDNETGFFFEGKMGFETITEDQKFYINENNNPVIVFEKYEIAPGSQGKQEFEIKK